MSSTDSSSTPRVDLPIPTGVTGGTGSSAAPFDEHELDVAGEAAATEAPAVADAIVRHAPFHGALQAGQRPGRQGIDTFGDAALRLRQAGDVGEDRLVADRRLRGACPAGHGFRQRRGDFALCLRALGRLSGRGLGSLVCLAGGHGGNPVGCGDDLSIQRRNELDRLPDPRFQVGVAVDALSCHPWTGDSTFASRAKSQPPPGCLR